MWLPSFEITWLSMLVNNDHSPGVTQSSKRAQSIAPLLKLSHDVSKACLTVQLADHIGPLGVWCWSVYRGYQHKLLSSTCCMCTPHIHPANSQGIYGWYESISCACMRNVSGDSSNRVIGSRLLQGSHPCHRPLPQRLPGGRSSSAHGACARPCHLASCSAASGAHGTREASAMPAGLRTTKVFPHPSFRTHHRLRTHQPEHRATS